VAFPSHADLRQALCRTAKVAAGNANVGLNNGEVGLNNGEVCLNNDDVCLILTIAVDNLG